MRVLLLSRLFLSGQTTHVVSLARTLRRLGASVALVAAGRIHPQAWHIYAPELSREGVDCVHLRTRAEIPETARRWAPDLLHCHSSDLLAAACDAGEALKVPVVYTCHGLGLRARLADLKRAAAIIAVGPRVQQELSRAGITASYLVGNGIDVEHFRPGRKERELAVAYVGRIDSSKRRGLLELAHAIGVVPRAHLFVAGNEGVSAPRCTYLGWVRDVAPLLGRCHALFGTGRAIREGMAAGCVGFVLGQRYGGMVTPQAVRALLARPGGFPSFSGLEGSYPDRRELARDLIRFWQDEPARLRLAQWSREFACAHFSLAQVARQTVEIYVQAGARAAL